jgi:hypothetical protein
MNKRSLQPFHSSTQASASCGEQQCRSPLRLRLGLACSLECSPRPVDSPASLDALLPRGFTVPPAVAVLLVPTASSPAAATARNRCAQRKTHLLIGLVREFEGALCNFSFFRRNSAVIDWPSWLQFWYCGVNLPTVWTEISILNCAVDHVIVEMCCLATFE